jgi:16S rRNA G966 N2-methylase RsmD
MAVNLKLTHAVKDRVVQNFKLNDSELLISFVDGSTMTVSIIESNSPPLRKGARIRQISEDQAKLLFECEDDSTLDVTLVDPGNSLIIRDKNNQVEYLG